MPSEMKTTHNLTALIEREGSDYVALCPELDIASQGGTVEESRRNLREALTLFFEEASPTEEASPEASPTEVKERLHSDVYVKQIEVVVG